MNTPDRDLLTTFLAGGPPAHDAFRTLTTRYVGLIYATARRQAPPHLAEDITQAVFLLLAQKAKSLRNPELLPAWLLQTTRFCAAAAHRQESRRRRREQEVAAMTPVQSDPAPADEHADLTPHLDTALLSLPSIDRTALLLRYYNDNSIAEIAVALNLSEEAAKKRVARALEKLRKLFLKKHLPLAAPPLATALAKQATAAPPLLAATCSTAALTPTTATTTATLLAKSTTKLLFWSNTKLTATTAALLLTTAGTAALLQHLHVAPPFLTTPIDAPAPLAAKITSSLSTLRRAKDPIPTIEVLDLTTNAPIPNAQIMITDGNLHGPILATATTGPDGKATLPYPSTIANNIHIIATKDGFVPVETIAARPLPTDPAPDHFTLRLERGTTIGERILDAAGNPLANVSVHVIADKNYDPDTFIPRDHELFVTTTNANGEWSLSNIPASCRQLFIGTSHPSSFPARGDTYLSDVFYDLAPDAPCFAPLHNETFTVRLFPAIPVTGTVHAPDGHPIKATISLANQRSPFPLPDISTDANGHFQIGLPKNTTVLGCAHADGFATTPFSITLAEQPLQTNITLQPAQPLALQILDPAGAPNPHPTVSIRYEYGQPGTNPYMFKCLVHYFFSDAAGNISWHDAVPQSLTAQDAISQRLTAQDAISQRLTAQITAPGYMYQSITLTPGAPNRITLLPQPLIHVHALDAATGKPVTDYHVIAGITPSLTSREIQWTDDPGARLNTRQLPDGSFEVTSTIQYPFPPYSDIHVPDWFPLYAIRAAGAHYAPSDSTPSPRDRHHYDNTHPLRAAPPLSSQLLVDADDAPLPHAVVLLITSRLNIHNADYPFTPELIKRDPYRYATTDNDGTFTFPPQKGHFLLVVANDTGYAFSTDKQLAQSGALLLYPWATINGTLLRPDGTPAPYVFINAFCQLPNPTFGPDIQYDTRTDNNGHFTIRHAPAGDYRFTAQTLPTYIEKQFHLRPAQTLTLTLKINPTSPPPNP